MLNDILIYYYKGYTYIQVILYIDEILIMLTSEFRTNNLISKSRDVSRNCYLVDLLLITVFSEAGRQEWEQAFFHGVAADPLEVLRGPV